MAMTFEKLSLSAHQDQGSPAEPSIRQHGVMP